MAWRDALERTLAYLHVQVPPPGEFEVIRGLTVQVVVVTICFVLIALLLWAMAQVPLLAP